MASSNNGNTSLFPLFGFICVNAVLLRITTHSFNFLFSYCFWLNLFIILSISKLCTVSVVTFLWDLLVVANIVFSSSRAYAV